ncbi:adenosine receptor A2b-like [Babylonia areolata]|uniref:adenosine receptor A2b-like n=1 Tax=Babylonia areolata TaxID=304850 RepID=UPI003FD24487
MSAWTAQDYLYVVAECVTGVLSMLGNALVLLAIAKTRALRTITNCFIGSLAAADVLVGVVLPPAVILPYLGLPRDFHGCVLLNTVVVLITNISILSMLAVALERYLAISDPFRYYRLMSVRRALMVVAITWVVAILLGLVPTMGWNLGSDGFEDCSFTKVIDMKYMVYMIFFGVTLPPLGFMLVVYLYIFHIVRKQQRAVAQLTVFSRDERQDVRKQQREVRGAKGLAYVIVLFAVCWLPIHIMNCVTLFAPENQASLQWHLVAIVLSHANSFINPFLYAFSNSKFKKAMLKLLLCGRCQQCYHTDLEDDSKFWASTASRNPNPYKDFMQGVNPDSWSTYDRINVLPSTSGQLGSFAEPLVSYNSASGVLNQAFSAGEMNIAEVENGHDLSNHPTSDSGSARQSETTAETPVTGDDQKRLSSGNSISRQNGHPQIRRPIMVASVADCAPTPASAQNGSRTQMWVTQSSVSPHHHSQGLPTEEPPDSELSRLSKAPEKPQIPGNVSPTDRQPQCFDNTKQGVQSCQQGEAEELERQNTTSSRIVSVRL